ncbi:MAG TPA: UDP-N-acetylmuramate--L-alanine ligase [Bacteroidales bacterium]
MHKIYFLGIGGIGMSALARYFMLKGAEVYGYDKTPTSLTNQLQAEGMKIHYSEDISMIPPAIDLVVYTPAVPAEHSEFRYLSKLGTPILKRAEVLGLISSEYHTIAIAGTHGKTTITTMTTHLLTQSEVGCSAFLGGISKNYGSNLLFSDNSPYLVAEADEFDRSFLHLHPQTAIITSMDADHLDIYGSAENLRESFLQFASQVVTNGNLIIHHSLILAFVNANSSRKLFTYGIECKADFSAQNLRLMKNHYTFDLHHPSGIINDITLGFPGYYNVENSVAAIAAALLNGVDKEAIRLSLPQFQGVIRRFDIRINEPTFAYIDDYAHHPAELKACILSARRMFAGRRITGIFQPHLYSRTRDFADEFARSLEMLDEVILLDIYPAREFPIAGITSAWLLEKINLKNKYLLPAAGVPEWLLLNRPDVLLTMGAGDIDLLVSPIEHLFSPIKNENHA